ncbi:MAG: hypothetical protein MR890_02780 [Akkermansia muciniphila]|nr:hypothetical protein [Akkermansia muciniphila]
MPRLRCLIPALSACIAALLLTGCPAVTRTSLAVYESGQSSLVAVGPDDTSDFRHENRPSVQINTPIFTDDSGNYYARLRVADARYDRSLCWSLHLPDYVMRRSPAGEPYLDCLRLRPGSHRESWVQLTKNATPPGGYPEFTGTLLRECPPPQGNLRVLQPRTLFLYHSRRTRPPYWQAALAGLDALVVDLPLSALLTAANTIAFVPANAIMSREDAGESEEPTSPKTPAR